MNPPTEDINRRDFMLKLSAIPPAGILLQGQGLESAQRFSNRLFEISVVGQPDCLWSYRLRSSGKEHRFTPPVFNIDSHPFTASLTNLKPSQSPVRLRNGAVEYSYEGTFVNHRDLALAMRFQAGEDNPIVRFRYVLKSNHQHQLTKPSGKDELNYLGFSFKDLPQAKEVRFSDFRGLLHSYVMEEFELPPRAFADQLAVMGPMTVGSARGESMLVAYEHGSAVPDAFLSFQLQPNRDVSLQAVKGNYLSGQTLNDRSPYQTVWFEAGAVADGEDQLASAFRTFILKYMTQNLGTRKPQIYYNTWNFQERNKWWNGKTYGSSMNQERILEEIDVAHRMGIDVYVVDGGWEEKMGDWTVNTERFPDGLRKVKNRLDRYGMQLGLWFGPSFALNSSKTFLDHRDCIAMWQGKERMLRPWDQPPGVYGMCLVSRYTDAFTDRLIQLGKELGATYFKWDGIGQYWCDAAGHWHGDDHQTRQERAESYAFHLVPQMARMADRIAAECPGAVIDFDITEAGRAVGLGFLSAGRFFLINNGPYYRNYDIPIDRQHHYSNIFVYPGAARTWICRSPLTYDKWIPSILFLTHYFPDDPRSSQEINLASLILGQNGIWGDLPGVSEVGVRLINETLARYKQVWNDMAEADPVVVGEVSGSPEFREKISRRTGRGAVAVFATSRGKYFYTTSRPVSSKHWASDGFNIHYDRQKHASLEVAFDQPGAKMVLFGVD